VRYVPSETPSEDHQVTVTEKGSFCTARCTCGWYAPARRSREKARRDADDHLRESRPVRTS
jgi:hypothetical protein